METFSFDEYCENVNLYNNCPNAKTEKKRANEDVDAMYNVNSTKKICSESNSTVQNIFHTANQSLAGPKENLILPALPTPIKIEPFSTTHTHPTSSSCTRPTKSDQNEKKESLIATQIVGAPEKLELDSSVSNLAWLQNISSVGEEVKMEPCANSDQQPNTRIQSHSQSSSVQSQNNNNQPNIQIISLPNNLQISNGNIQYISNKNPTTPHLLISSKLDPSQPMLRSQPFNSVTYNGGSYILSPNSAKPSSTVPDPIYPKPPYSYSCLIALAMKNSSSGSLPVAEIYNFMTRNFPYFKTAPDGWKNSVRHNLSLNKCFEKIENPNSDGINSRKGCLWALNPHKSKKMDDEILKWSRKDCSAIKRAMPNPDILEVLEKGQELSLPNRHPHVNMTSRQISPLHPNMAQQTQHMQQQQQQQQQQYFQYPSAGAMRMMRSGSMSSSTYSHPSPTLNQSMSHHEELHVTSQHGDTSQHTNRSGHRLNGSHMLSQYNSPQASGNNPPELNIGYQFSADHEFNLDPSLTELAIQSGIWDELPSDLLDLPFSNSPLETSSHLKSFNGTLPETGDQTNDQRVINAT